MLSVLIRKLGLHHNAGDRGTRRFSLQQCNGMLAHDHGWGGDFPTAVKQPERNCLLPLGVVLFM